MDNAFLVDCLKVLIENRSDDIACIYENKENYLELDEKIDKIINSISKSEAKYIQQLVVELKDTISKRNTIIIEALYKEGLIDGLSFIKTLRYIEK